MQVFVVASVNYYLLYAAAWSRTPPPPRLQVFLATAAAAARPVLEARLARVKDAALAPAYA